MCRIANFTKKKLLSVIPLHRYLNRWRHFLGQQNWDLASPHWKFACVYINDKHSNPHIFWLFRGVYTRRQYWQWKLHCCRSVKLRNRWLLIAQVPKVLWWTEAFSSKLIRLESIVLQSFFLATLHSPIISELT